MNDLDEQTQGTAKDAGALAMKLNETVANHFGISTASFEGGTVTEAHRSTTIAALASLSAVYLGGRKDDVDVFCARVREYANSPVVTGDQSQLN